MSLKHHHHHHHPSLQVNGFLCQKIVEKEKGCQHILAASSTATAATKSLQHFFSSKAVSFHILLWLLSTLSVVLRRIFFLECLHLLSLSLSFRFFTSFSLSLFLIRLLRLTLAESTQMCTEADRQAQCTLLLLALAMADNR